MNKERFGRNLKAARLKAGLTQSQLAQYAQIAGGAAPSVCNMEKGKHFPSLSTLFRMCQVLQVRADDLMGLGKTLVEEN